LGSRNGNAVKHAVVGLALVWTAACGSRSAKWDPTPLFQPGVLAIIHARVIPMDSEHLLMDHTVTVRDGLITAVGPTSMVRLDDRYRIIDGHGGYLIPGLADMHTHVRDTTDLVLYVAQEVTTIRILRGAPRHVRWREEIRRSERFGPPNLYVRPVHQRAQRGNARGSRSQLKRNPLDGAHALMSGQMRLRTVGPDSPGQCEPGLSDDRPRDPRRCYCPELSPRATRSSSS
jgi:hypothetical protein